MVRSAGYTASYSYDPVGRIASQAVTTSGGGGLAGTANGTYSYGDSAHFHAVTAIGSGGVPSYSAAYDAAGDMTCRALNSSSCNNTPATGQSLSYDALRRLVSWQGTTSGDSESYAYDGEGNRVWRQTTSGGTTTTTTVSILGVEDVTTVSGGASTTTRYYSLPGGVTATRDSSGLVYEATDALGTPIAALNLFSGITGEQLRAPYGQARYAANGTGSSGGMRTPYGFTGQREDTTPSGSSGLDYFNARYYDTATGRFTSADDAQPGLGDPSGMDDYAYVNGRVENATDLTGHWPPPEGVWRWLLEVLQATASTFIPHPPGTPYVPMPLPPDPPGIYWQQPPVNGPVTVNSIEEEISQESKAAADQIVAIVKNAIQDANLVGQTIGPQPDDSTEGYTPDPLRYQVEPPSEGTEQGTMDNEVGFPKSPPSGQETDNNPRPSNNPLEGDEGTTSPSSGQTGSPSSPSTQPKTTTEPKTTGPDERWVDEETETLEYDEFIAEIPAPIVVDPNNFDPGGAIEDPWALPGQVGGGNGGGGGPGGGVEQDSVIGSFAQFSTHWFG